MSTSTPTSLIEMSPPASKRNARRRARQSTPGSVSSTSTSTSSNSLSPAGELLRDLASESPVSESLSSFLDEDEFYNNDGLALLNDEEGTICAAEELDEAWHFEPKPGDSVWFKRKDAERETWYLGCVQHTTRTGTVRGGKQGTFYSVRYRRTHIRGFFAPLLGDIKPDTHRVRRLLELAGCDTVA